MCHEKAHGLYSLLNPWRRLNDSFQIDGKSQNRVQSRLEKRGSVWNGHLLTLFWYQRVVQPIALHVGRIACCQLDFSWGLCCCAMSACKEGCYRAYKGLELNFLCESFFIPNFENTWSKQVVIQLYSGKKELTCKRISIERIIICNWLICIANFGE